MHGQTLPSRHGSRASRSDALRPRRAAVPRAPGLGVDGARRGVVRGDDDAAEARCATALAAEVPFSTLEVVTERESRDGTLKTLFRTSDGHPVETVLMRYRDGRRSLCLSSQSGCPLTCTFCATRRDAVRHEPDASEILDQALHFRRRGAVNHAVYMGMGEPFLNVDARARVGREAARSRDHAPTDDDLHRRLDAGPAAVRRRRRGADPARALAARRRSGAPLRADAGERPLPARRGARRMPPLRRSSDAARCSSSTSCSPASTTARSTRGSSQRASTRRRSR